MFARCGSEPFRLGSACPSSCALAAFAMKLGAKIDPDFLMQCQIMDPKFQKLIDGLKAVPLNFEPPESIYQQQTDVYLDIDAQNPSYFYDSWQFKQHNSWIGTPEQWNSTSSDHDDIIIDLI